MAGPFGSLAQLVQNFESGGNYQAQNPTSTASGAYQFTNPTWLQYAPSAGVDTSKYPTAGSAPASVQDAVFGQAVAANGLGDWTCSGCNPKLVSYLQANPDARSLPTFGSGAGNAAGGGVSGAAGASGTTPVSGGAATTPAATGSATTATPAFYIIAIVLVVVLLTAGMWGLIKQG